MKFIKKPFIFLVVVFLVYTFFCFSIDNKRELNEIIDVIKKIEKTFSKDKDGLLSGKSITLRELLQKIPLVKKIKFSTQASNFLDELKFFTPQLKITDDMAELIFKRASLFGVEKTITSRIYVGKNVKGDASSLTIGVGFPGTFSILDLLPEMKQKFKKLTLSMLHKKFAQKLDKHGLTIDKLIGLADWIQFENVALVICLEKIFIDPKWGTLRQGINIIASVKFAGPLEKLTNIFGRDLTTLRFKGLLFPNENFIGSFIRIEYPGTYPLIKIPGFLEVRTGNRAFVVGIAEISVGIPGPSITGVLGMQVKLPGQKEFVDLYGYTTLYAEKAVIGGMSSGMVENLLGIPGLDFGNLGLQATISYATAAASGGAMPITGGAITGEIAIGKSSLKLLGKFEYTPPDIAPTLILEGSLPEKISHHDIIDFASNLGSKSPKIKKVKLAKEFLKKRFEKIIPPFEIGDFKAYIASETAVIFGKVYKKGVHFKGTTIIGGLGGEIELKVNLGLIYGVKGKVYFKQIKIPKKNPILIISGAGLDGKRGTEDDGPIASLELTIKKQIFFVDGIIEIPFLGLKRSERVKLTPFGGLSIDIETDFAGLNTAFTINGNPKSFDSFFVKGHIKDNGLKHFELLFRKRVNAIAKKLDQDLRKAKAKVTKWKLKAKNDIDRWVKNKIAQTQWHIEQLQKKINKVKKDCEAGNKISCLNKISIPKWNIEKNALKIHRTVTLKKLIKQVAKIGTSLVSDASIIGLMAARGLVEEVRRNSNFIGNIVKGTFNISSITYKGTLKDFVIKGAGITVRVIGEIFGNKVDQEFQTDLKNPKQLPKQIINFMKTSLGAQ